MGDTDTAGTLTSSASTMSPRGGDGDPFFLRDEEDNDVISDKEGECPIHEDDGEEDDNSVDEEEEEEEEDEEFEDLPAELSSEEEEEDLVHEDDGKEDDEEGDDNSVDEEGDDVIHYEDEEEEEEEEEEGPVHEDDGEDDDDSVDEEEEEDEDCEDLPAELSSEKEEEEGDDNSVDEDEEVENEDCEDHPAEVSSEEEGDDLVHDDDGEEDGEEGDDISVDEEEEDEDCEDHPAEVSSEELVVGIGEVKAAAEEDAGVSETGRKRMRAEKDGAVWEYEADCSVCLEPWTEEGPHQSCSLKCGHTFGRSCIEEWVRDWNKNQCPKCKKRCKMSDIRSIYPKRVAVVENALQKELDIIRAEKRLLEEEVKTKTAILESATLEIESVRKETASCFKRMDDMCAYQRQQFQLLHDRVWVLHTNYIGPTERYIVPPVPSPEWLPS